MKGKKVSESLNRLHVAQPARRDNRVCRFFLEFSCETNKNNKKIEIKVI